MVYAAVRDGYVMKSLDDEKKNLEFLFEMILEYVLSFSGSVDEFL